MKTKLVNGKKEIFDPVRKRYVACTAEEVVRQAYIKFLTETLCVPIVNIAVEKKLLVNRQTRRFDIVVSVKGKCAVVVECKAPTVDLSEDALFQAAAYNSVLQADYIVLFNGESQLVCKKEQETYRLCGSLPHFSQWVSGNG
ncbi:MAG: type I restriction enzyme HsdR N-terminal domain-containing protein [Lentimicrobiaceae bacterium]|nr:type I restriction enzyme HsdR N-terminal domain-containing protein [Lentimicrobiaceae bacterium]